MQDIVLFGIQGSGKGTQGKILAQKYGLKIFETGGELRRQIASNSSLGQKIKAIVEAGKLVDTAVIVEVVEDFLKNVPADQPVLFDGLPRKMDQKEAFDALMRKYQREFIGIVVSISLAEARKRLTTRRMCQKCKAIYPAFYQKSGCEVCGGNLEIRSDDSNLTAIENRLKAYQEETLPVIEAYQQEKKLIQVNGEQPIEMVTADLITHLTYLSFLRRQESRGTGIKTLNRRHKN